MANFGKLLVELKRDLKVFSIETEDVVLQNEKYRKDLEKFKFSTDEFRELVKHLSGNVGNISLMEAFYKRKSLYRRELYKFRELVLIPGLVSKKDGSNSGIIDIIDKIIKVIENV
ncbi:MAG: hypothetical protein DHS20C18_19330 [Saprospiraceae bacterium]|nr:MAG: hypothetical protein DHS20C18_19330 [Saprospiraceae bacterium]